MSKRSYNETDAPGCGGKVVDADRIRAVQACLPAPGVLNELASLYKVLGDATRVRILHALSQAELCVCDLAALLALSPSAVSHQLRLLRMARLVRYRREGRMVYYTLDDEHVRGLLQEGLHHVEEETS